MRIHDFQQKVGLWCIDLFGSVIGANVATRCFRFAEEAVELTQSFGMSKASWHRILDYVYERPVGEPVQEVGGTMVTLAALCAAAGINMESAAVMEQRRCEQPEVMEKIRNKQRLKPNPGDELPAQVPWPARLTTNYCCARAVGTGSAVCEDCAAWSEGLSKAMSVDAVPARTMPASFPAAIAPLVEHAMAVDLAEPDADEPSFHLNNTGEAAVADDTYYFDMTTCPRNVKVLLLGPGNVATLGVYTGDTQWKGWFPLPKARKK